MPARLQVLRFAAAFVWADLEVRRSEREFLSNLADELGVGAGAVGPLVDRPPAPEDVDPSRVPASVAPAVRTAALRAIASDGHVAPSEMRLFDLLDALLPPEIPAVDPRADRRGSTVEAPM